MEELATLRFVEDKCSAAWRPKATASIVLPTPGGYRVYYTTAADLVAKTQRAALEGRWHPLLRLFE